MRRFHISIDKIKTIFILRRAVSASFLGNDFEDLCTMRLMKEGWIIKEKNGSGKMNAYQVGFSLVKMDRSEGTVFLGLIRNEYRSEESGNRQILLEWNPNKTELPRTLLWWLNRIGSRYSYTRSVDVAMDFEDCFPHDFRVFTKRNTSTYNDGTIYIDSGAPSGAIRIYDKTAERRAKGVDLGKQVTRVEIRLKLPRYSETISLMSDGDRLYWEDVCNRLGEIYVPTDFRRLVYDVEQETGRQADPAILYMLRTLKHDQLHHALKLMNRKTATFYRKLLHTADVDRLVFDELILMQETLNMVNRVIDPLRQEYPEEQGSWYDQKKKREERGVNDLLDELRNRIKRMNEKIPMEDEP